MTQTNFPQVKSVLPMTVTNKQSLCIYLNPWAFHFLPLKKRWVSSWGGAWLLAHQNQLPMQILFWVSTPLLWFWNNPSTLLLGVPLSVIPTAAGLQDVTITHLCFGPQARKNRMPMASVALLSQEPIQGSVNVLLLPSSLLPPSLTPLYWGPAG